MVVSVLMSSLVAVLIISQPVLWFYWSAQEVGYRSQILIETVL